MAGNQEQILVYTPKASQRLRYVLNVFFNYIVRADYHLTAIAADFTAYSGPKIEYSNTSTSDHTCIHIPSSGLLQDNTDFGDFVVNQFFVEASNCLNQDQNEPYRYNFDLFALCFYLLSQYELYQDHTPKDSLGRLTANNSMLFQAGLLDRPLVDELCLQVTRTLQQTWPRLKVTFPEYKYTPSYDIDVSFAFGHRSLFRQLGAITKDLTKADWQKTRLRWRVHRGWESDPFDTFDYLDRLHQQYALAPLYFFLLGDYGGLDRNIHYQQPAQRQLFYQLAQKYNCGLHPSLRTKKNNPQLIKELNRFQQICDQPARHSRQHYLVLDLPHTYRSLIQQGIRHEYSLGYADHPGFRAGIARPFPWYDLDREVSTDLLLHPFIIMDQALRRVEDKDHSSLSEKILSFARAAKAVNGHVYSVWHNSSFSSLEGWGAWKQNYETLIKQFI